jgi:hypothetical protein
MANLYFKPFQDLIKEYCTQHVDVQHGLDGRVAFARMDADEDINSIPNNAGPSVVIIENFAGRTIGDAEDRQMVQTAQIIFLTVAQTGLGENAREIEKAQAQSESIMLDFESRMWHDYLQDECGLFKNMMWHLTSFEPVEKLLENHYGWVMTINFKNYKPGFDSGKWIL